MRLILTQTTDPKKLKNKKMTLKSISSNRESKEQIIIEIAKYEVARTMLKDR